MITVTEAALDEIRAYFNGKQITPIRVFLNNCGCGGPSLAMALDERKDSDHSETIGGFHFIVDKAFWDQVQPIDIDFGPKGFKLGCAVAFSSGCASSCG